MFENMSKEYPEDPEKFPNKSTITKEYITAKLKIIRAGFKKAADAGLKGCRGRVVLMFCNLCENLWGGSPAVTSLKFGVETSSNHDQSEELKNHYSQHIYHLPMDLQIIMVPLLIL